MGEQTIEKVHKVEPRERDSFKKMILELAPAAQKIATAALKMRRSGRTKDGKINKPKTIPSKSIDFARWVMEQYAKIALPQDADIHELHVVDHAMLAQMRKANEIVQEINSYNRTRNRGLDIESN